MNIIPIILIIFIVPAVGLGILLILAPVRGFCDEIVNNDRITARRLWIFRRTVYISDIDHCKVTRGGIHIYTKGSKIRKMSIDSMSINVDNWMQRMEQENIQIIVKGTLQQNIRIPPPL